jgi:hypothetical protein
MHTVKQLLKQGVIFIVPENDKDLKWVVTDGNCGLYYSKEQELPLHVKYLDEHPEVKAALKRNAISFHQRLSKGRI